MADFAERNDFFLNLEGGCVWDPACGTGSELAYLARRHPTISFIGSDFVPGFVSEASLRNESLPNVQFHPANFFDAPPTLMSQVRAAWFSQTLLLFDDWRLVLQRLCSYPIERLVFSTLMYAGPIESQVHHSLLDEDGSEVHRVNYNVLSIPSTIKYLESINFECIDIEEFGIDKHLDPPKRPGLGSYTIEVAGNKRLIFSGWQVMPWHFAYFRRKIPATK